MAKILVVDDAEVQRAELRKELEAAGFDIVEAKDGYDGLRVIDENPDISLVICDVNMPGMDGLTMCSKVKEAGKIPHAPIFMLTTEATPANAKAAKEIGIRAWVTKPFVASKLIEAAKRVLKN